MVQIIEENRKPTFLDRLGNLFGPALQSFAQAAPEEYRGSKERQQLGGLIGQDVSDIRNPDIQKLLLQGKLAQQLEKEKLTGKNAQQKEKLDFLNKIFNQGATSQENISEQMPQQTEEGQEMGGFDASKISDEQIAAASLIDPNIARNLQHAKDVALREKREEQKFKFEKGGREYQEAKPTIEYANNLALSLDNQNQDIEGMENALKNKNFGYFSRDNLAELTGIEGFRSKEGALFKSSIKNYFLSDVKGVGGKGLNQWLEKQLSDAMLKIGRDNAANETVLAGFRARHDRDDKWLQEYRKLYKQQKEKNGYISGDIGQEVFEKVKPYYEARQRQLEAEIKTIKNSGKGLSGKIVDVIGPDGSEYEIDKSQIDELPEGYRIK